MFTYIASKLFHLAGWRLTGAVPYKEKKFILAVAPHARTIDFPIGLGARAATGIWVRYLGKSDLFKPPLGWLMRALGGYPVIRTERTNLVDSIVDIFNAHEEFSACIAPEGTRKDVTELKTGFYYMAVGAKVPIIFCGFDYPRKAVDFSEPFYPTGNWEADKVVIARYFAGIQGVKKTWVHKYLAS